jgi:hypothetical protein
MPSDASENNVGRGWIVTNFQASQKPLVKQASKSGYYTHFHHGWVVPPVVGLFGNP